jgi:DNA repair protein RadA/Sms
MAKARSQFVCQNCGAVTHRWQGKCESCDEWNAIVEEGSSAPTRTGGGGGGNSIRGRIIDLQPLDGESSESARIITGVSEFDRVVGGGLVPGSALLVGGEPGIGKSTLLLQACASAARRGRRVIYVSGEESVDQVRMRARRLDLTDAKVELAAETSVDDILTSLAAGPTPDFLVLDSIQTLWTGRSDSAPGTVAQVRAAAQMMIAFAKRTDTTVCFVGHVTKDGQIAGPKTVEHMVDVVLSFEGEGSQLFRVVRAQKNRFGPTDEIGVFEMTGSGLAEVANPSELFLTERDPTTAGVAVFAGMEVLCEIQALVAPSMLGTPRRAIVGWDSARLATVLAVLEARCGVRMGASDVYLNVAGGLRIAEPAADLAVAAALVSSMTGRPLAADAVFFGEVSLSGAVRMVGLAATRIREAERLGFARAIAPQAIVDSGGTQGLDCRGVSDLFELVTLIGGNQVREGTTFPEESEQLSATVA